MTYFFIFAAVAAGLWLVSLVCCGLAIRWSWQEVPRRFWASVVLAVVGLGIGYLGLHTHITYSKTVNGRGWSIDSKWFFLAPLVLGALALALALWSRKKMNRVADEN